MFADTASEDVFAARLDHMIDLRHGWRCWPRACRGSKSRRLWRTCYRQGAHRADDARP